jgi:outer membrane protein OmpA-like peptidoglycan-associated protein
VLPTGSDLITAVYSGDASYTMASGSTTLTVTLPSFGLTLVFPNSKSVLSQAFVASIKRYVATVKAKQFTHITIVGYSKSGGKASVARTVSIAQASAVAKAVKAQLRAAGVTRVVVTFSGVGATAFHVTPGKSPRNQRTVITAS